MRRQALSAPAEMHRYPGSRCGELVGRGGRGWAGLGLTAGRLVRAGGPLVYTWHPDASFVASVGPSRCASARALAPAAPHPPAGIVIAVLGGAARGARCAAADARRARAGWCTSGTGTARRTRASRPPTASRRSRCWSGMRTARCWRCCRPAPCAPAPPPRAPSAPPRRRLVSLVTAD